MEDEAIPYSSNTDMDPEEFEETVPLLPDMVVGNVSISQQVLVSQQTLSVSQKRTQYFAALVVTIGGLIAGTSLAWTSPAAIALNRGDYGFSVSDDNLAWIGSFMPLGAIVGSIITAWLVDLIGRKNLIHLVIIPCFVGWTAMAFANSVLMICIGRFLTGIASGCFCIVVPMYIAEIAEKDIRGTLGTYLQLQITLGILLIYTIGTFVHVFTLTIICAAVPLVYGALMFLLPETPYFLLMKKNVSQAQQSLIWFRGSNYDGKHELAIAQKSIEDDEADKIPCLQAFQTKAAKRGLIIGLGVMFLQQFSGCNAVIFYTETIFKDAAGTSDSSKNSNLSTIIVGIAQVVTTWIASLIVDKLGRRILLLLSIVVMTLCTFTLGLYFYLQENKQDVSDIRWVPLVSLCGFIIIFSLGFGPIPWMLMAEIFPSKIKGTASSLACLFNWTCVFIVTKLFPLFRVIFGSGITFWCFTVCSGLGIFFVLFMVPETKGKTLLEVQLMLGGDNEENIRARSTNENQTDHVYGESKIRL